MRLTLFYVALGLAVAAVAIVIPVGEDRRPPQSIAGGYDALGEAPCLGAVPAAPKGTPLPSTAPSSAEVTGPSFDVKQSGQFVNLSNTQGTARRQAAPRRGPCADGSRRLYGEVDCVDGERATSRDRHFGGDKGTAITGDRR